MAVRRVGTWKDAARRLADASAAALLPGGAGLFGILRLVDGYLFPQEAVVLYRLARDLPGEGEIVEVGSYRGRSTLCLASGIRDRGRGRIVSVDPHVYRSEQELRENLAHFDLADRVEVRVEPSLTAARSWDRPLRAVFLDGSHEEEDVAADVAAWIPHLGRGGILLLHDATPLSRYPGPVRVAARTFRDGTMFDATGTVGSMAWGRREGG